MVVRGNSLVHGLWIVVKHGLSLSMVTTQVHGLKLPKSSKNNNIEREREFGSTFLRIGKNTSWLTSDLGILFFFSFFFFLKKISVMFLKALPFLTASSSLFYEDNFLVNLAQDHVYYKMQIL